MTTLLLLSLAGAAAAAPELVSVLEAFDGPADGLDVFGPPGRFSPGTLDLASADGALRSGWLRGRRPQLRGPR